MTNLEQQRAARALKQLTLPGADITGPEGGDILSKMPTMIVADGLLATAAFACSKGNGYKILMEGIFEHLAKLKLVQGDNLEERMVNLAQARDTIILRRATSESIAYSNYLKRFGKMIRRQSTADNTDPDEI